METYRFASPIELEATFTCGQIYGWWRDGDGYATTVGQDALAVAPAEDGVLARTDGLERSDVRGFLGLDADLDAVLDAIAVDGPTRRAVAAHRGLRLLNIPPWHCLVGFVASQRATVERTTTMVRALCERHGEPVPGVGAHRVPSPPRIASIGTGALEDCGFGYRAEYLAATAEAVAAGDVALEGLSDREYGEAKRRLKALPGVGDKVADCVLLFGCGFRDVVALDTRLRAIVDEHYPEIASSTYTETAERFRDRFSPHTGYAQTYLYHDAA